MMIRNENVLLQKLSKVTHFITPSTNESDIIQEGCSCDLLQRLNDIINVNMTHKNSQPKAALQLLDTMMNVLRLQQVEPAHDDQAMNPIFIEYC